MVDNQEGQPIVASEKKLEYLSIRGGSLGFTYTIDKALPTVLQHGLLSRLEERKRGLKVRVYESRSVPTMIYFTTSVDDVYVRNDDEGTTDEQMAKVVGIGIDRPNFAKVQEGHFGMEDAVNPKEFKVLVFIDQYAVDTGKRIYGVPSYRFNGHLSEDKINARLETLKTICKQSGRSIPIYGVSGDMYWPERKSRGEIWDMHVRRLRSQGNIQELTIMMSWYHFLSAES